MNKYCDNNMEQKLDLLNSMDPMLEYSMSEEMKGKIRDIMSSKSIKKSITEYFDEID